MHKYIQVDRKAFERDVNFVKCAVTVVVPFAASTFAFHSDC